MVYAVGANVRNETLNDWELEKGWVDEAAAAAAVKHNNEVSNIRPQS